MFNPNYTILISNINIIIAIKFAFKNIYFFLNDNVIHKNMFMINLDLPSRQHAFNDRTSIPLTGEAFSRRRREWRLLDGRFNWKIVIGSVCFYGVRRHSHREPEDSQDVDVPRDYRFFHVYVPLLVLPRSNSFFSIFFSII